MRRYAIPAGCLAFAALVAAGCGDDRPASPAAVPAAPPAVVKPAEPGDDALPTEVRVGAPEGGDSPEQVYLRMLDARRFGDEIGFVECHAPDDRLGLALDAIRNASFAIALAPTGKASLEKEYAALLERYHLGSIAKDPFPTIDDSAAGTAYAKKHIPVDSAPYIVQAFTSLAGSVPDAARHPPDQDGRLPADTLIGRERLAPLHDVRIDGDHATALARNRPVAFVRIGGRWFVRYAP